jgi:two-component system chemotaxis sensor kinase CheA
VELNRYLDLYLSESQDHLRLLSSSLLALEDGEAPSQAIEEAFRAAHTLKGMSATMGFSAVTDIAHILENLLDEIRSGSRIVDGATIDELLAGTDRLERAIAASASGQAPEAALGGEFVTHASDAPVPSPSIAKLLAGQLYAQILLRAEEPMKIAG